MIQKQGVCVSSSICAEVLLQEKIFSFPLFSAPGSRMCLGESLARMELFIFFTTLLQYFRFTPAPGVTEDQLDLTPRGGITLSPSPHKLLAVCRM
ncbi:Cytochrome P450 2K1 [Xenoophorus captivus]|uniref:Cytochrome P450 2K1 n=1 Tax=Xenoophorus captivus TaxID=1517983 RepID=A0ABV0R061_9TELE